MTDYESIKDKLSDQFWRLNNLYWIIDEHSNRVKFSMRPAQLKFFKDMWYWNILLKSRQHGFSTEIDILGLDLCLFNDNIEAGIIAHTDKDVQKIFATKVKYPYDNLLECIKERIPLVKGNARQLKFSNNSCISVGLTMRSATLHFLHVSEHGKICAKYPQKAEELRSGTIPTLHEGSYFFNESTAEGGAGDFYDACNQAMADTAEAKKNNATLNKKQAKFHFFAWWEDKKNQTDPKGIKVSDELKRYFQVLEKDHNIETTVNQQAWYALIRDGAMGLGYLMKREHPSYPAEAFEQSVEGGVFGREIADAMDQGRICFLPYDESNPVYTFWDLGVGHPTSILFVQFIGREVRIIDYHEEASRGVVYHCGVVKKKPYLYQKHYVPHDSAKRSRETATPLIDTIGELLGTSNVEIVPRTHHKSDSIEAARRIFPYCQFEKTKSVRLLKCLSFYRYEWDDSQARYKDNPVDDWSADGSDAFQGLGMVWLEMSINGKRLGSTSPIAGDLSSKTQGTYNNNLLTRGRL